MYISSTAVAGGESRFFAVTSCVVVDFPFDDGGDDNDDDGDAVNVLDDGDTN
jgi:hypothetical protein